MDKRYYIVQVNNGSEAFQSPFIAPGTFMLEERNSGSKFVRYMHPPHSEEDILFINELVNTYSCAPDNWPIFLAEVRGVAGLKFFLKNFIQFLILLKISIFFLL